jgi:hypothetical protein
MKITKDIVRDLLPAYLAGDASAETRAAVEEYLGKFADLRQIVEAAGTHSPPLPAAPAGLEVRSLERTRLLLGHKNFWLGFALIFCLGAPILRPLWIADFVMLIGLGGWAPFLVACRKLNTAGLETPRGWGPQHRWATVGALVGLAVGVLLRQHKGWHSPEPIFVVINMLSIMISGVLLATGIGEMLHQIQRSPELRGPHISTLFGKDVPK